MVKKLLEKSLLLENFLNFVRNTHKTKTMYLKYLLDEEKFCGATGTLALPKSLLQSAHPATLCVNPYKDLTAFIEVLVH